MPYDLVNLSVSTETYVDQDVVVDADDEGSEQAEIMRLMSPSDMVSMETMTSILVGELNTLGKIRHSLESMRKDSVELSVVGREVVNNHLRAIDRVLGGGTTTSLGLESFDAMYDYTDSLESIGAKIKRGYEAVKKFVMDLIKKVMDWFKGTSVMYRKYIGQALRLRKAIKDLGVNNPGWNTEGPDMTVDGNGDWVSKLGALVTRVSTGWDFTALERELGRAPMNEVATNIDNAIAEFFRRTDGLKSLKPAALEVAMRDITKDARNSIISFLNGVPAYPKGQQITVNESVTSGDGQRVGFATLGGMVNVELAPISGKKTVTLDEYKVDKSRTLPTPSLVTMDRLLGSLITNMQKSSALASRFEADDRAAKALKSLDEATKKFIDEMKDVKGNDKYDHQLLIFDAYLGNFTTFANIYNGVRRDLIRGHALGVRNFLQWATATIKSHRGDK